MKRSHSPIRRIAVHSPLLRKCPPSVSPTASCRHRSPSTLADHSRIASKCRWQLQLYSLLHPQCSKAGEEEGRDPLLGSIKRQANPSLSVLRERRADRFSSSWMTADSIVPEWERLVLSLHRHAPQSKKNVKRGAAAPTEKRPPFRLGMTEARYNSLFGRFGRTGVEGRLPASRSC